jgi:hypothetical protein
MGVEFKFKQLYREIAIITSSYFETQQVMQLKL